MKGRKKDIEQRTPYEDMLLEHIERLLDMETFSKDCYLVSSTNDNGEIDLSRLACSPDLIKLQATTESVKEVIEKSLWLRNNLIISPYLALKLPFDIDTKSLILYDLQNGVYQKEINQYTNFIFGNEKNYTIKRHKNGLQIIFQDSATLIVFWRTLNYCMIKGYNAKAMVLTKKTPHQYYLAHSQSMIFSHPKISTPSKKKPKKEPLKIIKFDESDFPPL
ncbi:hypothetical protein TVAG_445750 [Trichomonas vaginalis G3]|uniref:Uncharacterized protein n=1 Tax=Trichomonas vaginalis (strain ATCC PRA-98 / G3) TaxID=412133 RepID=A2FW69_TRIV3|nr:hypothetical protein TVAGG3_0071240 [Trichomonas vaginalis G3]EAX90855.1 hypothetical protein TVAG_445750 [Trichomonas vaginalis G3]KAI5542514.1 hypothetical protein TVAGG3_0071240 [Trichomonas vaginalis G3]|eukprot:XP_001303785.1 hypothetical protein [Trichomonas vaginalis G3]